jgi:hypothetical protein
LNFTSIDSPSPISNQKSAITMSLLSSLLFLLLAAWPLLSFMALLISLPSKRWRLARAILVIDGTIVGLYAIALVSVSLTSPQVTLLPGQELCFDDLCYTVAGVTAVPAISAPDGPVQAAGIFYEVTVQVRNSGRGSIGLGTPVCIHAVSESSLQVLFSLPGQQAYDLAHQQAPPTAVAAAVSPWVRRLAPNESSSKTFVFDLPAASQRAVGKQPSGLVVNECTWIGAFIIGDENSFLHKRTTFMLPAGPF